MIVQNINGFNQISTAFNSINEFTGTIMKTSVSLVLFILLSINAFTQSNGDDCQKCGQRMILCWDLDILTTSPVTTEDSMNWRQLHYASDGYIGEIMTKEQGSCLSFLPACRIGSGANPWQNPCPYNGSSSTDTYNTDYEMFGDISGSEGAYVLRLFLVTVKRETVVSVTKNFEKASDARWYGNLAALDLGGTSGGSSRLAQVIYDFEVKKRDAAQGIKFNRTAMNAMVKFNSETKTVKKGEHLPVEIQLMDCDDEPLKAAKLELQVAVGHFEKSEVETDDNGMAHAVYIAPDKDGTAEVKVEYNYRHPSEKLGFASDFTTIEIIDERQVRFTADSYVVEAFNEIPVNIELKGCEKQDLSSAILELTAQKGKFKSNKLKPDAHGIAHAFYTASGETGTDQVKVDYRYTLPDGEEKYVSDSRNIKIVRPGLWLLTAKITETYTMERDTVISFMAGNLKWDQEKRCNVKEMSGCEVTAVIENQAEDPDKDFSFNSEAGEPVKINVSGNGSRNEFSSYVETIDGKLINADIRNDNVSGSALPGAGIQFDYSAEYKYIGIGIGINAVGSYKGRMFGYGPGLPAWSDYGEDIKNYNISCSGGADPANDKNCKILKTATGYHATWKLSQHEQKSSIDGTSHITTESFLDVTISPVKKSAK